MSSTVPDTKEPLGKRAVGSEERLSGCCGLYMLDASDNKQYKNKDAKLCERDEKSFHQHLKVICKSDACREKTQSFDSMLQ